jgi:hypothetical protein
MARRTPAVGMDPQLGSLLVFGSRSSACGHATDSLPLSLPRVRSGRWASFGLDRPYLDCHARCLELESSSHHTGPMAQRPHSQRQQADNASSLKPKHPHQAATATGRLTVPPKNAGLWVCGALWAQRRRAEGDQRAGRARVRQPHSARGVGGAQGGAPGWGPAPEQRPPQLVDVPSPLPLPSSSSPAPCRFRRRRGAYTSRPPRFAPLCTCTQRRPAPLGGGWNTTTFLSTRYRFQYIQATRHTSKPEYPLELPALELSVLEIWSQSGYPAG